MKTTKPSAAKGNTPTKKSMSLSDRTHGGDYLWAMSLAPDIDESKHWFQMIPATLFTAVVILVTRMYIYNRPMEQFFWSTESSEVNLTDFFSYYKMEFIGWMAILALLVLLYRVFTQSLAIKRSYAYLPMVVYIAFVFLSYAMSDYKAFALWGWNDRFEGTVPLLCYMVLLFYIINTVNSEKNVKWLIYPLAGTSALLCLLGLTQAMDHDFFRTVIGQKLLVPNMQMDSGLTSWQLIDEAAKAGKQYLSFQFQNKEIYQTVYNINYVSFYLTLLIPLFGMLFIRSVNRGKTEALWKKLAWGSLFALQVYNLIGSASSGGLLGMAVVVLLGVIVLNKRLLSWVKPVAILVIIAVLMGGVTYERWMPELSGAIHSVLGTNSTQETPVAPGTEGSASGEAPAAVEPGSLRPVIDYIETGKRDIRMSLNGNPLTIQVTTTAEGDIEGLVLLDKEEKALPLIPSPTEQGVFTIEDERFHDYAKIAYAYDQPSKLYYILVNTGEMQWPFAINDDQIYYRNQTGKFISLSDVPHIGWANNDGFGSGRGYIWSRTLPMLKDTVFVGHGADTYCAYFPHQDYAGKYNSQTFGGNINIVVDKPHNMFMGMMSGTGGISLLALLALWGIYIVQGVQLYCRSKFADDFLTFVGAGILFGITGFLVSGLVNDSSVSVMPMFYGLLGVGIAINMILKRRAL